ncbi:MAG: flagellar basal body P-ring formation chaperone FlgA [Gammaproteobacteria bacterium]
MILRHCLFFSLLFIIQGVSANSYQSLDTIRQSASDFVLSQFSGSTDQITAKAGKLDKRLRLNQCSSPLHFYFPQHGRRMGQTTVGVRCEDERPWSLFVPVSIHMYKEVAVLARPVPRGSVLSAEDIRMESHDVGTLSSGYFDDKDQIIGMELRHNLSTGGILNKNIIKVPVAVHRGELVTLLAGNSKIEVRTSGKALTDGAIGDRIQVRNLKSKRVVEGIIISGRMIDVRL